MNARRRPPSGQFGTASRREREKGPRGWFTGVPAYALLLAGCPHPVPAPAPGGVASEEPPPVEAPAPPPSTGGVRDGTWVDARYPLRVELPAGWGAVSPPEGTSLRATFRHGPTGVVVDVLGVAGGPSEPPGRDGCTWTYADTAPYRLPGREGTVTATLCLPDDPEQPRIQAWSVGEGEMTWYVEAALPPGQWRDGMEAVRGLLLAVDWGG